MIDPETGEIVKSVFLSMSLEEIASVDRPAQPGALMSIMKRAEKDPMDEEEEEQGDGEKKVVKRAVLTTPTDGHTHTFTDEVGFEAGRTMVGETSFNAGHSHPWVRNMETGEYVIGMVEGHTHNSQLDISSMDSAVTIKQGEAGVPDSAETSNSTSGVSADPVGNVPNEATMSEKNDQTVDNEAVAKQLEEVTKRAERAEAISELSDAQKGIFKSLEGEAADAFLKMSPAEREVEVTKAADANAVVYTDSEGSEYRKNDDPRLVAMAKRADEEKKLREDAEKEAKKADLTRRAESLAHLPGDTESHIAMLKGIDALPADEREAALKGLTATNEAMSKAFERAGTSGVPSETDPLQAIAKRIADADPKLTPEQAMAKALETPEGEAVYAKSIGLTR